MQPTAILYPVFVLIGLTFLLQMWMARERSGALQRGDVKVPDVALGQRAWPDRPTQIANSFHNQLEMPVLFYVLAAFAMITSRVDIVLVGFRMGVRGSAHLARLSFTRRTTRCGNASPSTPSGVIVLIIMWA